MTDDPSTKKWNIATAIALIVAIIAGIAVGYYVDLMMGIFTILIISGGYLAASFFIKDRNDRSGGPSEYGAAVMGGVLLAGIGACGFVYRFTDNVMITVACVLGVVMLASVVMIFFYKAYL
jgi:hypothetical protein